MGTFSKLYNNFIGGQIDDTMTGRIESDQYQTGASKLENVIVKADGSVSKRPGLMRRDDGSAIGKYTQGEGKHTVIENNWSQIYVEGKCDAYSLDDFFGAVENKISTKSIRTFHSSSTFAVRGDNIWNDILFRDAVPRKAQSERLIDKKDINKYNGFVYSYTFNSFYENPVLRYGAHNLTTALAQDIPGGMGLSAFYSLHRFYNYVNLKLYDQDGVVRIDMRVLGSEMSWDEFNSNVITYDDVEIPMCIFPGFKVEVKWLGLVVIQKKIDRSTVTNIEDYLKSPESMNISSGTVRIEDQGGQNPNRTIFMLGWGDRYDYNGIYSSSNPLFAKGYVYIRNIFTHEYKGDFNYFGERYYVATVEQPVISGKNTKYTFAEYDRTPNSLTSLVNGVGTSNLLRYTTFESWIKSLSGKGFLNKTYDKATDYEGDTRYGEFSCDTKFSSNLYRIVVREDSVGYYYSDNSGNGIEYIFSKGQIANGAPVLKWWNLKIERHEVGEDKQEITQKGDIDDARIYFLSNNNLGQESEKKFFVLFYLTGGNIWARLGHFMLRSEEEKQNVWYKMENDSIVVSTKFFSSLNGICITPNGMQFWITDSKEEPFTITVDPVGKSMRRDVVTLTSLKTTNAIYGWGLGFPSVNWFSGMRWFLSGFSNAPGTIIASRVPDADGNARYTDFTLYDLVTDSATGTESKSVLSSHGIMLTEEIPLLHNYRLNWVTHGLRDLFAYEDVVMMDSGQVPTPASYDLVPTLYGGFGNVQPVTYGGTIFFAGANNKTIRCMYYDDNAGGYVQSDITGSINAVIDKAGGVVRLAVQPGQNIYLWAVLADGTALCGLLVSQTYVAWALEKFSKRVLDIEPAYYTSVDGHNYERMIFCVANEIATEISIIDNEYSRLENCETYLDSSYVASVEQNEPLRLEDGKYFYIVKKILKSDSSTIFNFTSYFEKSALFIIDNTIMFPLDSYAGRFVTMEYSEDGKTYELTGIVSEKKAEERWGFGTPYTSSVQTLPMAYDEQNGIMFCRSRHINDIIFRVKNTGNFDVICNDPVSSEQVFNTKFYQEYKGGEAVPFKSGNYRMQFTSTVSDDAQIELRSDLPYPFNLLAMVVVGRVEDRL